MRARREGVFLHRPQAFLENPVGLEHWTVIICLIACDVPVMILTISLACNTMKVRTVTFKFVLVVGRGPCHSLSYLASNTVLTGLWARGQRGI